MAVRGQLYQVGREYRDKGKPRDSEDQFLRWLNMDGSGLSNSKGIRKLKYLSSGWQILDDLPAVIVLTSKAQAHKHRDALREGAGSSDGPRWARSGRVQKRLMFLIPRRRWMDASGGGLVEFEGR